MRLFRAFVIILLPLSICWAQVTFEVASVKIAAPLSPGEGTAGTGKPIGGPGTPSPEHISWRMTPMDRLIQQAYSVKRNQIVGPDWITHPDRDTRYDISATLPPNVTTEQVAIMLQALLKDRFQLRFHREMRERPVYTLNIAKGGDKLKRSQADSEVLPLGFRTLPGGVPRLTSRAVPLAQLVTAIGATAQSEDAMVVDNTGLEGKFDIELPSLDSYEKSLAGLISAIQKDLGLKVERGHAQMEVLVVDRVQKRPTEN